MYINLILKLVSIFQAWHNRHWYLDVMTQSKNCWHHVAGRLGMMMLITKIIIIIINEENTACFF